MKQTRITLAVLSLLLMAGCSRDTSPFSTQGPIELSALQKKVARGTNSFSCSIFKELAGGQADSNVCISPISISFALAMTANGAGGTTQAEMLETLGFDNLTIDEMNQAFSSLMSLLVSADPDVALTLANSIWYRQGFPFEKPFLDTCEEQYDALIQALDFSAENARDTINNWVKENTNGKIEQIVDDIDPSTVMFLINAIYFKGIWKYQFDPQDTFQGSFSTASGATVTCPMMQMTAALPVLKTSDFQAVDLAYGRGNFAMAVFVPEDGKTAQTIIQQFTSGLWDQWRQALQEAEQNDVTVEMPKFETRYEKKLNDALKTLGMPEAFSGAADFSNMCSAYDLYISLVRHKSYICVDEEGTEAAAVTSVEMRYTSTGHVVKVNKPFVFVIYDRDNGTILFQGVINNPLV